MKLDLELGVNIDIISYREFISLTWEYELMNYGNSNRNWTPGQYLIDFLILFHRYEKIFQIK